MLSLPWEERSGRSSALTLRRISFAISVRRTLSRSQPPCLQSFASSFGFSREVTRVTPGASRHQKSPSAGRLGPALPISHVHLICLVWLQPFCFIRSRQRGPIFSRPLSLVQR